MTGKRALIVDDSKSARVVLSRLLERHELAVDTLDSAESALVYLQENRPDVIFMDHVMPGMDGLKAVEAIKRDPSTASIPIMMYTSQDGELYAGEARALGAAGVMSKLSSPADLSQVLGHLQLLPAPAEPPPEQPATAAAPETAAATADATATAAAASAPPWPAATEIRGIVEPLLREQGVDLRRFVVASLESFAARVISEVGSNLTAAIAAAQPPPPVVVAPPPPAPVPLEPPPEPPRRPLGWMLLALAGLLTALAAGAFAWQQQRDRGALEARLAVESGALTAARRQLAALAAPPAPAETRPTAPPLRLPVPYGELPWTGPKLAALEAFLATLDQQGFAGTVRVTSFAGEYCLTGNPSEGYSPAPGEMPANRCDLVGNPFDDGLGSHQREPPALAAVLAVARARAHGRIEVLVGAGRRAGTGDGYPPAADASAAQWNQVATARNRIELTLEPRADGG